MGSPALSSFESAWDSCRGCKRSDLGQGQVAFVFLVTVLEASKSGFMNRLNFSGSARSSSRLKRSSSARVFSLIGAGFFDRFFRGTLKA
jgi:hypothetical protein